MHQPSRRFAVDFVFRPVRVLSGDRAAVRVAGKLPQAPGDRQALGGCFGSQHLDHLGIDELNARRASGQGRHDVTNDAVGWRQGHFVSYLRLVLRIDRNQVGCDMTSEKSSFDLAFRQRLFQLGNAGSGHLRVFQSQLLQSRHRFQVLQARVLQGGI